MRALANGPTLPRLAFRVGEAALALGVSPDHFTRHIAPELRWIRRGAVRLVARAELEAWLEREASRTLEGPCEPPGHWRTAGAHPHG